MSIKAPQGTESKSEQKSTRETSMYQQCREGYLCERFSIIVLGASGDLAKKKIYPTLLDLFTHGFIPKHVNIVGFARSDLSITNFRHLVHDSVRGKAQEEEIHTFLLRFHYVSGHYDSAESFRNLDTQLLELEAASIDAIASNRMFYFAIPPNVFIPSATCIRENCSSSTGWNRLVVEKPFGHDLASAQEMNKQLGNVWPEECIYRMDHYLGKEMVQNLLMFRFGNIFLEPLMNHRYIAAVSITFKENFGTMGRGGYFDHYGILRDIMQNHLMQVLSLVAMEPPVRVAGIADGQDSAQFIRDAKVNVLKSISTLTMDDIVIGQYTGDDKGNEGYLEDRTVPVDSITPTFAQAVLRINNPRWEGVPFIMKAGKALDERKAEVRIQFKDAPAGSFMFSGQAVPRNELVFRLQPDEAVYMKVNVKKPGLFSNITQSELDLTYSSRYEDIYNPDAYTRLLLDTVRGNQATFVRSDELIESWRIFSPVLHHIESNKIPPIPYIYGTRGPKEADEVARRLGVTRHEGYTWSKASKK